MHQGLKTVSLQVEKYTSYVHFRMLCGNSIGSSTKNTCSCSCISSSASIPCSCSRAANSTKEVVSSLCNIHQEVINRHSLGANAIDGVVEDEDVDAIRARQGAMVDWMMVAASSVVNLRQWMRQEFMKR